MMSFFIDWRTSCNSGVHNCLKENWGFYIFWKIRDPQDNVSLLREKIVYKYK